jgi:DNA-binding IclR family transcriptional regulator
MLEEWAEGINGVAAPIRDPSGALIGVINLYGPAYRFPGEVEADSVGRDVMQTASLVARHLTFDSTS